MTATYPRPAPGYPVDPWPMYAASYRLADRAAAACQNRDSIAAGSMMREHYDATALHYAAAACIAAKAGLCDISTAIDHDTQADIAGSSRPTLDQYRAAVLLAVDANRRPPTDRAPTVAPTTAGAPTPTPANRTGRYARTARTWPYMAPPARTAENRPAADAGTCPPTSTIATPKPCAAHPPTSRQEHDTMSDDTYNGWTNWETWNTALWMGHDAYLEPESRRIVADAIDDDPTDTYAAGIALRDWWEATFDPDETGAAPYPGPVLDAWSATLSATNWREIAASLLPDADE